ncbi:helix-turn-helix domain-containing protein [Mycobacterium sp.]|uniref:helix-turn-helix domain-containing protein n=1 Tax=Mycobacterium sp. TaxID=1785 RepID=UPI003D0F8D57
MDAVRRELRIPHAQRLVICHIGGTANRQGEQAWRANGDVAAELGVSVDTVTRARNAAVRYKLMVETKPAPRGAGNTKTAEYRLVMPPGNTCTSAGINGQAPLGNTGTSAPIWWEEIPAAERKNTRKTTPELPAPVRNPSGITSGITSGDARARERTDQPRNGSPTPTPLNEISLEPPKRACPLYPHSDPCRTCAVDKEAYKAWITDSRNLLRDLDGEYDRAAPERQREIKAERKPRIAVFQRIGEPWK